MKKLFLLLALISFIPLFVFAAFDTCQVGGILGILCVLGTILAYVIPILITLATVYFIWGVIQYLIFGEDDKKKKAKEMILSSLIGLFIIVSFWGIIKLFTNTFGVGPEQINEGAIPCIPNEGAGIVCE